MKSKNKKQRLKKSQAPKVQVYVPETKKEKTKKEVVKQEQHEDSDDDDIKEICENIMKIREHIGDETYGEKTLTKVMSGTLTSVDLTKIAAKISNKMDEVGL